VQREYLKRMYQVFAEKGITFASGALTLQTAPHQPVAASPGEIPGVAPPRAEALPRPEPPEVPALAPSARSVV
jgi:hypothetical protein